jgi:hypothetical protein
MPVGVKAFVPALRTAFNLNELLPTRGGRALINADRMGVEREACRMPSD